MLLAIVILAALSSQQAQAWDEVDASTVPCFDNREGCYPLVNNFSPIYLGRKANFEMSPLSQTLRQRLIKFYPDEWATIQEYPFFAIEKYGYDSGKGFATEIVFSLTQEGALQVGYVYSEESSLAKANIYRYRDKDVQQEMIRADLKNLDNMLRGGRDFQSPMAQVRLDDYRRAQAVRAVITVWEAAMHPEKSAVAEVTAADIR